MGRCLSGRGGFGRGVNGWSLGGRLSPGAPMRGYSR